MATKERGRTNQAIDHDRRRLLAAATMGVAAAGAASLLPSQLAAATADDATRPFQVNIPESDLTEMRRRISATRWPERETVTDDSQGVPLAMMQELARYWASEYDWRKCEAKLTPCRTS